MSDLAERVKACRLQILDLAHQHGARRVSLFGSLARGEESADSDIDLLVELEPGRSLFDLGGAVDGSPGALRTPG